jgi:hypothetical protein
MAKQRVKRGLYLHYKGDHYFVTGVGILDEDGHGDPAAPRQVIYESTCSVQTGLQNIRSEESFLEPVKWPDGVTRPRFRRIDP